MVGVKMKVKIGLFLCVVYLAITSRLVMADANVINADITRFDSFTAYSGNNFDVIIWLSEACPTGGKFYLPTGVTPNNINAGQVYSLLLAAFMSGKKVNINYQDGMSPNFTSASNYCEVRRVWVDK